LKALLEELIAIAVCSLSLSLFLLGNLQDNTHEVPVLHMVHIKKDHVFKHSLSYTHIWLKIVNVVDTGRL
jgi:hypothetical protein